MQCGMFSPTAWWQAAGFSVRQENFCIQWGRRTARVGVSGAISSRKLSGPMSIWRWGNAAEDDGTENRSDMRSAVSPDEWDISWKRLSPVHCWNKNTGGLECWMWKSEWWSIGLCKDDKRPLVGSLLTMVSNEGNSLWMCGYDARCSVSREAVELWE